MPKRKNEQTLKQVLHQLLDAYRLRAKFNEAKIVDCWEQLMGKAIANRTQYIYVRNGTLYLKLTSASLKQELFYAKEKIINLINKELGEEYVKEVVFR